MQTNCGLQFSKYRLLLLYQANIVLLRCDISRRHIGEKNIKEILKKNSISKIFSL